jgi:hypothetical protein
LELHELHVMPRTQTHDDGQQVIDFVQASSLGNFLSIVPEDVRDTFRMDLAAALERYREQSGIVVHDYGVLFVAGRSEAISPR